MHKTVTCIKRLRASAAACISGRVHQRCMHYLRGPREIDRGLNFAAALDYQRRSAAPHSIVTIFPDRMERYFSTELFAPLRGALEAQA